MSPPFAFHQIKVTILGVVLLGYSPLFCDEGKELVDNFLEQLEQSTEIATKNGLNIDFVPGNVSVISGEELKRLGCQTLNSTRFDMILGIENPVDTTRGTGGSYGRQKVLLLLNGVEIDNQTFGTNYYGAISVDLVDRVEIVRGPGSSVYGGYAVNGVVNVITKKEPHVISGHVDKIDNGRWLMATSVGESYSTDDSTISLSAYFKNDEGIKQIVEQDVLYAQGLGEFSYAPDEPEERFKTYSLLGRYDDYDDHMMLEYHTYRVGEGYGYATNGVLPPNDGEDNIETDRLVFDWKHDIDLGQWGILKLDSGYFRYEEDNWNLHYYPPIPDVVPYGINMEGVFDEQKYYAGMEWHGEKGSHRWMMGGKYSYTDVENVRFRSNMDPYTGENYPEMQAYSGNKNFMRENIDRAISSVYAQDEWKLSDKLIMTTGARYDNYDDIGSALSPRIAFVWEVDGHHILKMQYAHAFRPPTLIEIYTQNSTFWNDPGLEPEKSRTLEFTHIYRSGALRVSNTLLYNQLKDIIGLDVVSGVNGNIDEGRIYGWEVETKYAWQDIVVRANASFYDTHDETLDDSFRSSPAVLTNFWLTYEMLPKTIWTFWHHYVGEQKRSVGDVRKDYADRHFINVSFQMPISSVETTLYVKDLLDEEHGMPSAIGTFPEDIKKSGRTVGLQLSYRF